WHSATFDYSLYAPTERDFRAPQQDCHGDGSLYALNRQVGGSVLGRSSPDSSVFTQPGTHEDLAEQDTGR
ncbi:hypothetical protein KI387_003596, partial [Taxus chinensis]